MNEIELNKKNSLNEEKEMLIVDNKNSIINFETEMSSNASATSEQKPKINKKKCHFSFVFCFLILIILVTIASTIFFILFYIKNDKNFSEFIINWIPLDLNDRKYKNYIFNNGLEVMVIQDEKFDRDGGAIVIEKGYNYNISEEGISSFATSLLSHIAFSDPNNSDDDSNDSNDIPLLEDYYGKYEYEAGDTFTNFRFDILNSGFKKFLAQFGPIIKNFENDFIRDKIDKFYNKILDEMEHNYLSKISNIEYREDHLLEYFVYGFRNKTGGEILPEGNKEVISNYNRIDLKNKVIDYIEKLFNPQKIKIVLFSKFKFLVSSKYMKRHFSELINMNRKDIDEPEPEIKEFNKSQIFYIRANYYENNYIKIIYYIDKINNETFSELSYKSGYFNYISYFLNETKEGSLYSLLNNGSNHSVKSISSLSYVYLKSKLIFYIDIELNCLNNINDIIFKTYQYMHKIVEEAIGEKLQIDRYEEVRDLCYINHNIVEKTFNTIELARANGENIITSKYAPEYYFYYYCSLGQKTDNITNIEKVQKDTEPYFSQLKPENSVIILALRDKDRSQLTCNEHSPFYLNCSKFINEDMKNTTYYNVSYINDIFNPSDFEKDLDVNNSANITFQKNSFITHHNKPISNVIQANESIIKLTNETNKLNKFYFKENNNFRIPKVFISLSLFHPYLRPMNNDINIKRCYYFKIIEIFCAIKKKVYCQLSDAIRAGNEISFGQSENYLYINIFAYEDIIYEIAEQIKNITLDTNWNLTDFSSNNEIYKNEAFDEYFIYNKNHIGRISQYYLFTKLKNNLYNTYEFFPEEFEEEYYQKCIDHIEEEYESLITFIINGYIYGNCNKTKAEAIYHLFEIEDISLKFNELLRVVNNKKTNASEFVKWVTQIDTLNKSENITINRKILNNTYIHNISVTYIAFNESLLDITLFENVLNKAKRNNLFLVNEYLFNYGYKYFELMFNLEDNDMSKTYDKIVEDEWSDRLDSCYDYNRDVDNIGNRYYYLKKNFVSSLEKEQTSLRQRALDELRGFQSNNTIIDPAEVMKEYDAKYHSDTLSDEKELNNTIKKFKNLENRNRFNVFFFDE